MPGQVGQLIEISPDDPYGAYLVEFDGGFRFRYRSVELERLYCSLSIPGSTMDVITSDDAVPLLDSNRQVPSITSQYRTLDPQFSDRFPGN
jgi:hypothetical protein